VGDGELPTLFSTAERGNQHATTGESAGQNIIQHFSRFEPAQQCISATGDSADSTIGLVAMEREFGQLCQDIALVVKARAKTAGITFLQADNVKLGGEAGQIVKIGALSIRQDMRPGTRDIFTIGTRAGTGLNVAAQYSNGCLRIHHVWVVWPDAVLLAMQVSTAGIKKAA